MAVPGRNIAPACPSGLQQRPDERLGLDDTGRGRKKSRDGADGRLPSRDEGAVNDLQPLDAIGASSCQNGFQLLNLSIPCRHEQLAAPRVRDAVIATELIEQRSALDAQPGLQCAGRVVQARVNDAAVVRAGVEARPRMPLEDADRIPAPRHLACAGQAGHAGSDDSDVDLFHRALRQHHPRTRSHFLHGLGQVAAKETANAIASSSEQRVVFGGMPRITRAACLLQRSTKVAKHRHGVRPCHNEENSMEMALLKRPFTVDEFHRMAEAGVFGEDDRLELLDGEIVCMTAIGSRHAACVKRLNELLGQRVQESAIVGVQDPVVLAGDTELYPDVALLRRRPDFYSQSHPRPADVLLVIEVADTSAPYDRGVKLPRYARAGIPEVWVVDLQERVVDVYQRPAGEKYLHHERLKPGHTIAISQVPDRQLAVADVLA